MARLRTNFIRGTITNNPLAIGDTTINSGSLASLPVVSSPDIAVLILDPAGSAPEVVHVTAHTAAATSATITRAREGSAAKAHIQGTAFVHGLTGDDLPANAFPASVANGDVLYGVAATDEYVALAKPATPAGEVLTFATGATAPSWGSVGIAAILANIRDSKALIAFLDSLSLDNHTTGTLISPGLRVLKDGSGDLLPAGTRGGGWTLSTGTTANSQSMVLSLSTAGGVGALFGDRNPRASFVLTTQAANAALKTQAFGFIEGASSPSVSNYLTTTVHKAMFRSATTGALFAVTGNASAEETTSLSGSHTLGNLGTFDVYTEDDGVTWKFAIAGAVVATHTTQVPGATTGMDVVCGIENNTTTSMSMTGDLMQAYCDRT